MAQIGHTTPNLTLAIYARQMDRRDGERERLKALVAGRAWAEAGLPSVAVLRAQPRGTKPSR